MKKILFFILFSLFLVTPVKAQMTNDNHFASGENLKIEGDYNKDVFLSGSKINFSGNVAGDLFVIGQEVKIVGDIKGSVFFLASQIEIDAHIGGSVRGAGQKVILENYVDHNLTIFASSIESQAIVNWHGYLVAQDMNIGGQFERLDIKTTTAKLNPKIKDSLVIIGIGNNTKVELLAPSEINGDVVYTGKNKLIIADGVSVYGKLNEKNVIQPETKNFISYGQIFWWLVNLFGMILVGLLLIALLGNRLLNLPRFIEQEHYKLLLPGLLVFIFVPIVAVLLFISLIGIPLAVLLLLFYVLIYYLGQVLLAIWLGDYLWQRFKQKPKLTQDTKNYLFWCLVLGAIVWRFIVVLPILGGLLAWLISLLFLGGIWQLVKVNIKEN